MSPKQITVVGASGENMEMLGSQDRYNSLLSRLGVACLVDGDGFNANDFESLVDGGTYTLGPPPQQQRAAAYPTDPHIEAMRSFFGQDVASLKLGDDDHITVKRMAWFDDQIDRVYWRHCYSYILCSTIAFFEKCHRDFSSAVEGQPRQLNTMVLTGVQGTGKSILGAIVALFMAKLFGWEVHYDWKGKNVVVGKRRDKNRVIHVVDLSHGTSGVLPSGFVLLISLANSKWWHCLRKQQTWTERKGNFCFIDPATEAEVEVMAATRGEDAAVEKAKKVFHFVGGVPRLCLKLETAQEAKAMVDEGINAYSIKPLTIKLSSLDDSIGDSAKAPGIVGHIAPTNSFRNQFKIQMASPYVARKLVEKEGIDDHKKIQRLMKDLLTLPEARGFVGWIWEHFLTKKVHGNNARMSIVGSDLPVNATSPSFRTLLQKPTRSIKLFEFKDMREFLDKAQRHANDNGDFCAFAKAATDTFEAIDAIVMVREGTTFIMAALQLTVAEKYHPVKQSMIIEFVETCRLVSNQAEPQLWFLQPEECLSSFGFVQLQAMKFDQITYPSVAQQAPGTGKRSSRKRVRKDLFGEWVPSQNQGKLSSNNMTYWNLDVQNVRQCVGIVHIDSGATEADSKNTITDIKTTLKEVLRGPHHDRCSDASDPTLRSWVATTEIMASLKQRVDESLRAAIEKDIAIDKQNLVDAGLAFGEPTAAGGSQKTRHDDVAVSM